MYYFNNKEARALKAKNHTREMEEKYPDEILNSVQNTMLLKNKDPYIDIDESICVPKNNNIVFMQSTSTEAIDKLCKESQISNNTIQDISVLDFASYKSPGGMFYEGSSAQEEMLCHDSDLYNILSNKDIIEPLYYAPHIRNTNGCLYSDDMLFVPNVIFYDKYLCNVLVAAAPNKKAAVKYRMRSVGEIDYTLKKRIFAVVNNLSQLNQSTIILGAFGCGVFGNSIEDVAYYFIRETAIRFKGKFKKVIFAIPDQSTYEIFKTVLINEENKK